MVDYNALQEDLNDGAGEDTSSSNDNDYDDAPSLNVTPTVAVEYDDILDVGIMGGIKEEQNVLGGGDGKNSFGNDIVVTLENPRVGEGTLFASDQEYNADYKLVDTDHEKVEEDVKKVDGEFEVTGIQVYGNSFDSHEVDDFEEDAVKLMIGSWSGLRIAQLLDVQGGVSAYYDGDEKTSGLVEYPPEYGSDDYDPNSGDRYQRIARSPTLREDLRGEGVIFSYMDGRMHKIDVFNGEPTPSNKVSMVTDGGEPEWQPWIVWDTPEDEPQGSTESSNEDTDEPGDSDESSGDVDLSALEGGEEDTESTEITGYSDLSEEQQAFVDRLAESDNIDVENADVSELYRQFAEDNGLDPIDAGIIEDIIVTAAA